MTPPVEDNGKHLLTICCYSQDMSAIAQDGAFSRSERRPVLQVQVVDSAIDAATFWDELAAGGAGSAYQGRAFLQPWMTHVAPAIGVQPRLGLVRDDGGHPLALLPFAASRIGPLRSIVYLGGRDINLNMPLLRANTRFAPDDVEMLLRRFADGVGLQPDLFILSNQPRTWAGAANPFVNGGSFPSPSNVYGGAFPESVETYLARQDSAATRKKLRSKAAKLAEQGVVTFSRATAAEAPHVIATLIAQKEDRLATRGIDAGLDTPPVRQFLSALASPDGRDPVLELYVLQVNDALAAILGGLRHGQHWHGLVNSYADDPAIARHSPGELLLRHVLRDLEQRGVRSFDLGIGEARYKTAVCDEAIELFDTIVPITARGKVFATAETLRIRAKRFVKRTPWALAAVRRIKQTMSRSTHA